MGGRVGNVAALLLGLVASTLAQDPNDVFDNGLAKKCTKIDKALDLLFILDGSGSVSGNTFDTQMSQVYKIVDMVDIAPDKTQLAVIQYSGYSRMEFNFNENMNKSALITSLQNIRHMSGTTKTGKALEKALDAFRHDAGARVDREGVAQVAVVVSDGHSHDDPVPAANLLRQSGVKVMALGIGNHINMDELVQITGDDVLAFRNDSLENFVREFHKLAIGEHCEYAKDREARFRATLKREPGPNGAEILCQENSIEVNVLTTKPFKGHLYVSGQFDDSHCVAQASKEKDDKSVSLRIPLMGCGIQKQFLFTTPRGILFETGVILKFHPEYNTKHDKVFVVRCFYPDTKFNEVLGIESNGSNSIVNGVRSSGDRPSLGLPSGLIGDPLVASSSVPELHMPCAYKVTRKSDSCVLEDTKVGDTLIHRWECDKAIFGTDFGMLVHSCSLVSMKTKKETLLIDEHGCSLDQSVIGHPEYPDSLTAAVPGMAVKYADNSLMKYRCSLRFCNIASGECDKILPPKCGNNTAIVDRPKRQVESHSANMDGIPAQVVERLFMRHKYNRLPSGLNRASVAGLPTFEDEGASSGSRYVRPPPLLTFGPPIVRNSGSVNGVVNEERLHNRARVHPPFRPSLGINIGSSQQVVARVNPITTVEPIVLSSTEPALVIKAREPNFPWNAQHFPVNANSSVSSTSSTPQPSTASSAASKAESPSTTEATSPPSLGVPVLRPWDLPIAVDLTRKINREQELQQQLLGQPSVILASRPSEPGRPSSAGDGQPGTQVLRSLSSLSNRPLLINPSAPLGPDGRPTVFQLPEGGMDLKLNTQNVVIVNGESKKNEKKLNLKNASVGDALEGSGEEESPNNLPVLSRSHSLNKEQEPVTDKIIPVSAGTTAASTASVPKTQSTKSHSVLSAEDIRDEEILVADAPDTASPSTVTTTTPVPQTKATSTSTVPPTTETTRAATHGANTSASSSTTTDSEIQIEVDANSTTAAQPFEPSNSTSTVSSVATIDPVETNKIRLRGLAVEILAQINTMQVDLESQILNVHDLEDFRNQGRSPVNWCTRSSIEL